jgi:VCBS repeat-containing protein
MLSRIFGASKARRSRASFRRKLQFESLEQRLLLSADGLNPAAAELLLCNASNESPIVADQPQASGPVLAAALSGTSTGRVFEDGGKLAVGELALSDVPPGTPLTWSVLDPFGLPAGGVGLGAYGFLNVDTATGAWSYNLDNFAFQVQSLAQGEQAFDSFTVQVADAFGAVLGSDSVTITVTGTNDLPGISANMPPSGLVSEDGVGIAQGELFGADIDNGASFTWSIGPAPTGYSADYLYTADRLSVTRNGTPFFSDEFDNDLPPVGGIYGVGGIFAEAGGRMIFDGSLGSATLGIGTSELRAQNNAVLLFDAGPDLGQGLKIDDDIVYEAAFDLAVPQAGSAYGIALSDRLNNSQAGDDLLQLNVFGDGAGGLRVVFADADIVADMVSELESLSFGVPAGGAQIVLRLMHDNDAPGELRGAFDVVDGTGTVMLSHSFAAVGHIFGSGTPDYPGDDEVWTRPQITAFGRDTNGNAMQGAYGTLSIDPSGHWTYVLDNDAPQVQALDAGDSVSERFWVRVVDQFGTSSRAPIDITITGAEEGLEIGGATTGEVFEDGARPAVGQLTPPSSAPVLWAVEAPAGVYGSLSVEATTGLWTYTLFNDAPQVQDLAQGEQQVEQFTVTVSDLGGVIDSATIAVTVTGTNDFPSLAPVPVADVTEDGIGTASGQAFGFDRDHGAQLHYSVGTGPTGYSADYRFTADRLRVERDGVTILDDGFDDGFIPTTSSASHPGFSLNGPLVEQGGRLVLDGAVAGAATGAGTSDFMVGNIATLLTNTDPLNTVNGLKRNHDFTVELTYDLLVPAPGQGYSLTLGDRLTTSPATSMLGDDTLYLTVYSNPLGQLELRFEER